MEHMLFLFAALEGLMEMMHLKNIVSEHLDTLFK
jgi:hypothetical protein